MLRRVIIGFCGLMLLIFLFQAQWKSEGQSRSIGGAYDSAFNQALLEYASANPDARAVREGFHTIRSPRTPCVPSAKRTALLDTCTAVSSDATVTPAWLRAFSPSRVVIRVPSVVWADPAARSVILSLARSRRLVCQTLISNGTVEGKLGSRALACANPGAPSELQVWVAVSDVPLTTCVPSSAGDRATSVTSTTCTHSRDSVRGFRAS
jgi:hypothetical protein